MAVDTKMRSFRMPFGVSERLDAEAKRLGAASTALLLEALEQRLSGEGVASGSGQEAPEVALMPAEVGDRLGAWAARLGIGVEALQVSLLIKGMDLLDNPVAAARSEPVRVRVVDPTMNGAAVDVSKLNLPMGPKEYRPGVLLGIGTPKK